MPNSLRPQFKIVGLAFLLSVFPVLAQESPMMPDPTLHFLNIVPLMADRVDEICADIVDLARTGVYVEPTFSFTLVPEGTPPFDKARQLGDIFQRYRDALTPQGLKPGILVQASLGHGWKPDSVSPFQKFRLDTLEYPYIHCPLDADFRAYVRQAIRHLASLRPSFFMIDDDVRMLTGRGGCFCPLHVAEFNRREGTSHTAEEMARLVKTDLESRRSFYDFQLETLNDLAKIIRQAIDEVAPGTPCSFCGCARDVQHIPTIAKTLSAAGQDGIVRINNGLYLRNNPTQFPGWLRETRRQQLLLSAECQVMTEADTCPQLRYSTDTAVMHANITLALLQGFAGAKLWITRMSDYQPDSGKAYREHLKKYGGFYRTLRSMSITWQGLNQPVPRLPDNPYAPIHGQDCPGWGNGVFSLLGLPFRYDLPDDGPSMLAGEETEAFSDEEIRRMLTHCLLLDGQAAHNLARRGFGGLLGVEDVVVPTEKVSLELCADGARMTGSPVAMVLKGVSPSAEILSTFYHRGWALDTQLAEQGPGVIRFQNSLGGTAVVMGATVTPFGHPAFFLLNETRKRQLAQILANFGLLPVMFAGDSRVIFQAGRDGEGRLCFYACNCSNDVLEEFPLAGQSLPMGDAHLEHLLPDGTWETVVCPQRNDETWSIPVSLKPLFPEVFRLPLLTQE